MPVEALRPSVCMLLLMVPVCGLGYVRTHTYAHAGPYHVLCLLNHDWLYIHPY